MSRSSLFTHDLQVLALAFLSGLPGLLLAGWLLWTGAGSPALRWTLALFAVSCSLGLSFLVRERVVRPLRTLGGVLAALSEGDFSIQVRGARQGDPLGDLAFEVNALIRVLREQRLGALETTALLRTVMEEINLAIFAFDDRHTLRLVNRAGEKLLAQPSERLLGRTARELNLLECLESESARTFQAAFPGGLGRWGMRRSTFRQGGLPHQLLVIADLSQALREEERQAWQRLLRVLGHELNNSLAPIKSISGSLAELFHREPLPDDWLIDARHGLNAISSRADALSRFMEAYSKLARLPQPKLRATAIDALIRRVSGLETRLNVILVPGPEITTMADPDQLEQLLINLLKNAADAALQTHGNVHLGWNISAGTLEIWVEDDGPGLSNTANLFVPFFTTKPGGSGIGLALSRQIAEAHGGTLTLENRPGRAGCTARFILPLPE